MNTAPVVVDEFFTVEENQTISFNPLENDYDPDGDTLQIIRVFSAYDNSGYSYYYGDNVIEYTATGYYNPDWAYDYISYVVTDGNGVEVVGTTQIKINIVNDAPVIDFYDTTYYENDTYSLYIYAYDEEDNSSPSVTLSGPDSSAFSQVGMYGDFNFIEIPDFENPADANGDNIYEFTLSATDSEGLTTSIDATIAILDLPEFGITEGDDTVRGTETSEYLDLLGGNDLFFGFGGDDYASGNDGDDTLKGGDDGDYLNGDAGEDELKGGSGSDYLSGGDGKDRIFGGADSDYLHGDGDDDLIFGGNSYDYLNGGEGNDSLYGENGADNLNGDYGDDRLWGGADNDYLEGGAGNDSLYGEAGSDDLSGGEGSDLLLGGAADDSLYGGADNDVLLGGAGNDIHFGGAGNDIIRGDKGGDELYGGSGNDKLQGGDGNDWLDGGEGNDRLDGGSGHNYIVTGDGADTVIIGHYDGAITENDDIDFSQDVLVIRAFDGNARTEITSEAQLYALDLEGLTVSDDGVTTYLNFDLEDGTSHQFWLNGFTNYELG